MSYAFAPAREIIRKWSGLVDSKKSDMRSNIAIEVHSNVVAELQTRLSATDSGYFDRSAANVNVHLEPFSLEPTASHSASIDAGAPH